MYTSQNQRMTSPDHWGIDARGQRSCFTSPREARKATDYAQVCSGPPSARKTGGKRSRASVRA